MWIISGYALNAQWRCYNIDFLHVRNANDLFLIQIALESGNNALLESVLNFRAGWTFELGNYLESACPKGGFLGEIGKLIIEMIEIFNVEIGEILSFALTAGTGCQNKSWSASNFKARVWRWNKLESGACPLLNSIFNIFFFMPLDLFVVEFEVIMGIEDFIGKVHWWQECWVVKK